VKEHRIQLGGQFKAARLIPDEGQFYVAHRIDIAHIARERRYIMRRVGEFQHGLADDFGSWGRNSIPKQWAAGLKAISEAATAPARIQRQIYFR
jgi:hypothetical protein